MPTCSYIVQTKLHKKAAVAGSLQLLVGCTVYPAENNDEMLLLVTDTSTPEEEKQLQVDIKAISDIECISMSFAYTENK